MSLTNKNETIDTNYHLKVLGVVFDKTLAWNIMHILRIAENNWKKRMKRETLDELKRANPSSWTNYGTASMAVKVMTTVQPAYLKMLFKDIDDLKVF